MALLNNNSSFIISMSILSSENAGLPGIINYIEQQLHIPSHKYTFDPKTKTIDVHGDVVLIGFESKTLFEPFPFIRFGKVDGNLICSYSELRDMKGFPQFIGGNLDISFSPIRLLTDISADINRHFIGLDLPFKESEVRQYSRILGRVYL